MSKQTPPDGNTRRELRVPLDAQVELKFENFQGFLDEIAANISTGGMFVQGTNPPPVGTVVDFSLKLQDDYALIQGQGEVTWVRARDAGPQAPAGVGIRFLKLQEPSGELIKKIVEKFEQEGGEAFDLQRGEPIPASTPEATLEPGSEFDLEAVLEAETVAPPPSSSPASPSRLSTPPPAPPPAKPVPRVAATAAAFEPDPDLDSAVLQLDLPPEETPPVAAVIFTPPDPTPAVPASPAPAPVPPSPPGTGLGPLRPLAGDKPPPPRKSGLGKGVRRPSFLLVALLALSAILGAGAYRFTEMLVEWGTGYASEAEEASRFRDIPPPPPPQQTPTPRPAVPEGQGSGEAAIEASAAGAPSDPEPAMADVLPAGPTMTQVRLITWKSLPGDRGTQVTLRGNGRFDLDHLTQGRLPSRLVLKLRFIDWPVRAPVLDVGSSEVRRIRTGYHPKATGNELHIVLDLTDDAVQLADLQVEDNDIHLFLRR